MNKIIVIAFVIIIFVLSGCSNIQENNIESKVFTETKSDLTISGDIEKVEVFHFHGTHQCYSCKTVGNYAKETVNTFFEDELNSGKIIFDHINRDLPENKEMVMKYGVTGSSLCIGVYDKNGFHSEENLNVWYKIKDKQDYMNYLKGIISKRLSGDFS